MGFKSGCKSRILRCKKSTLRIPELPLPQVMVDAG